MTRPTYPEKIFGRVTDPARREISGVSGRTAEKGTAAEKGTFLIIDN